MIYRKIEIAGAVLVAAICCALSGLAGAQEIPAQLKAPAGEELLLRVHAKGDQIYACKGDGAKFVWTLKAPEAQLFDKDGKVGSSDVTSQPASPRTSRSVFSETAGRQSSATGLESEKQLSNRLAPGRVARRTAAT